MRMLKCYNLFSVLVYYLIIDKNDKGHSSFLIYSRTSNTFPFRIYYNFYENTNRVIAPNSPNFIVCSNPNKSFRLSIMGTHLGSRAASSV